MTLTLLAISTLFLLIKVIKNLSKVFLQQYNYPKFIWIKQNISFACSNYRSNWQLIDNFCLHLSEPNCIETRRKRIMNQIVTTEPQCTVISVNRFTFSFLLCHHEIQRLIHGIGWVVPNEHWLVIFRPLNHGKYHVDYLAMYLDCFVRHV